MLTVASGAEIAAKRRIGEGSNVVRVFNLYFPTSTVFQIGLEAALIFVAAIFGAVLYYPWTVGVELLGIIPKAVAIAIAMTILFSVLGLYKTEQPRGYPAIVARILVAFLFGLPLLHWMFYALPNGELCREALDATLMFGLAGNLSLRAAFQRAETVSPFFARRVLILGTGSEAASVENELRKTGVPGLHVVGFYPIESEENVVPTHRILSSAISVTETVNRFDIHEIIVAVAERRGGLVPWNNLLHCKLVGINVLDLSAFFERCWGQVRIESLRASWFIYGDGFRQGLARTLVKRTFDIVVSASLLLLAMPVMFLTAFAIMLESGRPVIYRQERVGQGGRSFNVFKFRSMFTDAESDGKPRWAQANDDRVTRVGRFIRKTRIDELPQLFNVLKGDMSLVGPRPERPFFVRQLEHQLPFYEVRHSVKPGVTGWAQVCYEYGASVDDAGNKLRYDLYYVKNHSLFLDFLILFKTIRVVLTGHGSR
jgi:sugar transferase (PEP-CTERM system associated)